MSNRLNTPNDLRAFWMPFTANRQFKKEPRFFVGAKDMYYTTHDGRQVLDGTAGLWCVNAGHCRPKITEAIREQAGELDYAPAFQLGHPKAFELANRLVDIAPEGMDHVLYTNSGSESVETALKVALAYHRAKGDGARSRLIGRERGYHGVNFGGISVGGIVSNRKMFGTLLTGVDHMPHTHFPDKNAFTRGEPEHGGDIASELQRIITLHDASTIAAVIVEPVAGSTGVLIPPKGYLQKLREICTQHGILLIFDEVITGFGRLGTPFAAQYFDVKPDIITTAKGLTSGYLPLGACIFSERIWKVIGEADKGRCFAHGFTYSGHPVSCVSALKNIEIIERENLLEHVNDVGAYLEQRLRELASLPLVGDVRCQKLMACVEFVADKRHKTLFPEELNIGEKIHLRAQKRGLLVRPIVHLNVMSPPLTITRAQVDEIVDTLREAILETAEDLKRSGDYAGH